MGFSELEQMEGNWLPSLTILPQIILIRNKCDDWPAV
jgi:hypothetical protein